MGDEEEPVAQIYSEIAPGMESAIGAPTIKAVDHYILSTPVEPQSTQPETKLSEETNKPLAAIEEEVLPIPPIVDAAPILEDTSPLAQSTILGSAVLDGMATPLPEVS